MTGGIVGTADDASAVLTTEDCIGYQTTIKVIVDAAVQTSRILSYTNAAVVLTNNFGSDATIQDDPNGTGFVSDATGLDGADITAAQFTDDTFFANNLPNWDFGTFGGGVWRMSTDFGPLLKWQEDPTSTAIRRLKMTSKAQVYSSNGKVYVRGAEKNSIIRFYNITGTLLRETRVNSTNETFDSKGLVIIEIVSPKARGTYKVNSL